MPASLPLRRVPGAALRAAAVALAAALAGAPPAPAQEAPAPAAPGATIGVAPWATEALAQDRAIARRIRDILAERDGSRNVIVEVRAGLVTLSGRVAEPERIRRLDDLVARVDRVVTVGNRVTESTDLAERLSPAVGRFELRLAQAVALLPVAMVALVAGGAVVGGGRLLARLRRPFGRLAPNEFIADISRQIVRVGFFVAGVVVALDILGAAGIVGFAISFAVRDTVETFVASVMPCVRQPFRPNDLIEIEATPAR